MPIKQDPFNSYNFLVEIDNITSAAFQECSGLESEIEKIEYAEGAHNSVRKFPGQVKFSPITLKRGTTDDRELYDWHQGIIDGTMDLRNISVIGLKRNDDECLRYNLFNAWISKWTATNFNAQASEIAIETIEICYERIERA